MSIDAETTPDAAHSSQSHFTGEDVMAVLLERRWLRDESCSADNPAMVAWFERAAELLGPQTADRAELADLLALIFRYDAAALLSEAASQDVLAREGGRDVIRELANRILGGGEVDSDSFKNIIDAMKQAVPYRSRAMFHPIRLALAGRAGDGYLDRVILLLDSAAKLDFAVPVKDTHKRMLEFCAALD
jgi:hypothetical protein